jgi:ATP-dependent DNA helicase RecG
MLLHRRGNDQRFDQASVEVLIARLRTSRPYAFKDLDHVAVLRRAKVLVSDQAGQDAVSLAGLLALGFYPQEHFPQLMVTFIHYPTVAGTQSATGERFLDNVTLEGSIPVMARDTLAVIRRNMSRRAVIADAGRQDLWEYPETALREAVVNALVHRDLSSSARGTQIQVEMYPDRLVIKNPGGLFGPVTSNFCTGWSPRQRSTARQAQANPLPNPTASPYTNSLYAKYATPPRVHRQSRISLRTRA